MPVVTTRTMPSFEGVSPGSRPIVRLPIGLTYITLLLTYKNLALDEVTDVEINVNGTPQMTFASLSELDAWNRQRNRGAAPDAVDSTGVIALDFVRYNMRTEGARMATALGTGLSDDPNPVQTLNMSMSLAQNLQSSGTPQLELKALQTAPMHSGLVKHVRRFPYPFSGTGFSRYPTCRVACRSIDYW